ncbi:MAG TPA: cation:proton antiporter family protein [Solirubrobacteraceae bacterium]|nr:cation:proton antiporter family protein [Solirubrobacteraceae bacterium]
MTFDHAFHEIAVLLLVAAFVGALALRFRQPLIVAFLVVGILAGPSGFEIVSAEDEIELLAELGIALLLFVVGLKLDLRLIRTTGRVALIAGLAQILFTAIVGFAIVLTLGLDVAAALYVAVALTFSSTIIIVKLLSDKREIDDLHGRIAVGILIVQDIVVVLAMITLTAVGAGEGGDVTTEVLLVVLKGGLLIGGLGLLMRYVLTPVLHRLAHSPELLVLAAIAWGVGLAAGGDMLGFSQEVGAFLGGVALASSPYREAIAGRLVPLRDFLLLFFFLDLGARLDLGGLGDQLASALVLSGFVLIGKPLIVMVVMGLMGYRKRVGFLTGVTLSQISEFSLILGALGVTLGHIDDEALALITAVGLITISVSTYAILYSHRFYERVAPRLGVFERSRVEFAGEEDDEGDAEPVEIVVCGGGRYGGRMAHALAEQGRRVLLVDFDPRALSAWRDEGRPAMYGDIEDPELAAALPLDQAHWIVSTVPRLDANFALLHTLGHYGYGGRTAVTTHHDAEIALLYDRGADAVLSPFADAVRDAAKLLADRR